MLIRSLVMPSELSNYKTFYKRCLAGQTKWLKQVQQRNGAAHFLRNPGKDLNRGGKKTQAVKEVSICFIKCFIHSDLVCVTGVSLRKPRYKCPGIWKVRTAGSLRKLFAFCQQFVVLLKEIHLSFIIKKCRLNCLIITKESFLQTCVPGARIIPVT